MIRINLGCGFDVRSGWVNIDKRALPGIDIQYDLDQQPWPLPDDCAEEIVALDVFEHLRDVIDAMNECWRILIVGGRLTVRGPVPESPNLWVDVSHRRAFVEHSFDHFDWSTDFGRRYHYGIGPWKIVTAQRENGNIVFVIVKQSRHEV
ncbi:hypothetical protein TFLX_03145 [Thermoflexales bacterium]|nr:hypothetical protein TFLX_03145 [Thermoflexales bacterium]